MQNRHRDKNKKDNVKLHSRTVLVPRSYHARYHSNISPPLLHTRWL